MYNLSMNEVKAPLNSSTAGFAFTASTVIFVFIQLIISLITVGTGLAPESDGYKYLGYLAAPLAITVGCAITLKFRKHSLLNQVIKPVGCNAKYFVIAVMMIFGLLFCVSELSTLFLSLLEKLGYTPREQSSYLPSLDGGKIVAALLVIAVLPAVFEELLFRGIILKGARNSMGDIRAIFIVGFCFALFHGSAEQTIYQFICGCAFAFLAVRAGSILPTILMHFINNALIIAFSAAGLIDASGMFAIPDSVNIALTVIGAVAFAGSVLWLILDKKPLVKCQKGGVAPFFIYGGAGVAVHTIIWIFSWL